MYQWSRWELAELPAALEQIDGSLHTLVFLHWLPTPDPELVQAFAQIYTTVADVTVWFVVEKPVGRLPKEFGDAGVLGTLSPAFTVSRLHFAFVGVIDSTNTYYC